MNVHSHRSRHVVDRSVPAGRRPADAERRQRILEAAERAFVRHGFHATTMQHVADEAGMSAGNLYRYFPSKEAIVEGLCELDQAERAGRLSPSSWPATAISRRRCARPARARARQAAGEGAADRRDLGRGRAQSARRRDHARDRRRCARGPRAAHRRGESGGRGVARARFPFRRAVLSHLCRRPLQAHRDRARFRRRSGDRRWRSACFKALFAGALAPDPARGRGGPTDATDPDHRRRGRRGGAWRRLGGERRRALRRCRRALMDKLAPGQGRRLPRRRAKPQPRRRARSSRRRSPSFPRPSASSSTGCSSPARWWRARKRWSRARIDGLRSSSSTPRTATG